MKRLFGKKDKADGGSPAPPDDNPYARQPKEDPYANAPSANSYQQNRPSGGLPSGPRAGVGLPSGPRAGGLPSGPRGNGGFNGPPPPYSGSPQPGASRGPEPPRGGGGGGYGNDRFGASGGYGGNRYDNGGASYDNKQPGQSYNPPQRQGGYGGLGAADDDGRGALFNGYKPPTQRQTSQNNSSWESGPDGPAQGSASGGSYGGYGETRELTEEEQQEMEVQDIKKEIINTQKATMASGARSMALVGSGAESAMNIAQALARQREHLDNAERNIDNASVHNRIAKDQTRRLDKLNGSMFRPTGLSKKKLDILDAEREVAEKAEMAARDEARKGAYSGRMRMDGVMQDLQRPTQLGAAKGNRSRREEFKFEDDDGEQEANNEEIDNQIDQISAGVSMLHGAARIIGDELEDQIRQVDRITGKSEIANDQVRNNHGKLLRAARMQN